MSKKKNTIPSAFEDALSGLGYTGGEESGEGVTIIDDDFMTDDDIVKDQPKPDDQKDPEDDNDPGKAKEDDSKIPDGVLD